MNAEDFKSRLGTIISSEKSLNDFAKKCDITGSLMRNYLYGKSLPGLDKLIVIANVANVEIKWLATGEGEMKRIETEAWKNLRAPGLGERIKEIRGKESTSLFAARLNIDEGDLIKYESDAASPDVNFLAGLCREFRINPGWLLVGLSPKIIDDVVYLDDEREVVAVLDEKILREILESIEQTNYELIEEGLVTKEECLKLSKNAEVIAYCYEEEINREISKLPKIKKAKVKRLMGFIGKEK